MTPARIAELMARATRPRRTVPIVCGGELAEQIQGVQDDIAALDRSPGGGRLASKSNAAKIAELDKLLDSLYEQAADDTLLVVVEGLQGTPFEALKAAHPPRLDDEGKPREGWDRIHGCNPVTMREPMIRAAVVGIRAEPDDPVEPVPDGMLDWLLGFATIEQAESLFLAAWNCSRGDDAVPLRHRRSTTQTSVDE